MLIRHLAISALIVSGLSVALLFDEFHAISSDAGQHYAIIRILMDLDGWLKLSSIPANLGPSLAHYPPVSHWLAANVGRVAGSGFIGMTAVASAAVGLFYLAMFVLSQRLNSRAPLIACAITIAYALLRGPVFGRQIVNNYFFAQAVGSTLTIWTLLVVLNKFHKWKGIVLDLTVLGAGQIIIATHLTPAAQLSAAYCTILLVHAWTRSSWLIFGRLILFSVLSLVFAFANAFTHELIVNAQFEAEAHINHLLGGRIAQITFLILGCYASIKLILKTHKDEDAGMFLGCMCLSACGLAFVQIALFWFGFGSGYAISKHIFLSMALFIFVVSANIAVGRQAPTAVSGQQCDDEFGVVLHTSLISN